MDDLDGRSLKENADSLSYIENNSADETYTFGDLRKEVDDVVALSVLGAAAYIDEEEQEIGVHKDIFEPVLESESYRRGLTDRPLGLETAALAGGAAGTVASGWKFLEDGGLEYLGTGAASLLLGKSALKRIGAKVRADLAADAASRELDKATFYETYELNLMDDEDIRREPGTNFDPEINVLTREEFEDMSEEELVEELED